MSFEDLGLSQTIAETVIELGYKTPTPVQVKAIPEVMKGKDVLVGAQTGTGKTAAFSLPIIQRIGENMKTGLKNPRALILTPTRELAIQVESSIRRYAEKTPIRSIAVYGGERIQSQKNKIKEGVDIVVATPGRLFDHIAANNIKLDDIDMFVLDEADRMLDLGFIDAIRKIIKKLPQYRQTMMFSATYNKGIKNIAGTVLRDPVHIEVTTRNAAAQNVSHFVYPIVRERKKMLLSHLIKEEKLEQVLVFTRTKKGADSVAKELRAQNIKATAIHSDKNQFERSRALKSFKSKSVRILVATDIAARGLDIDTLPHVINYEMPEVAEDYIHRIGRTGRAGAKGTAYSFVSDHEIEILAKIETMLSKKIERKFVPGIKKLAVTTQAAKKHDREVRQAKKDPFAKMGIMRKRNPNKKKKRR